MTLGNPENSIGQQKNESNILAKANIALTDMMKFLFEIEISLDQQQVTKDFKERNVPMGLLICSHTYS